jgi:hypothetical protein
MLRANSMLVSTDSSEVCGPRTTSTSCITSAGLKKCTLSSRPGLVTRSAKNEDGIVEELLARSASCGAWRSSSVKSCVLASRSSAMLSMTRSAPAVASARSVVVVTRSSARWHSSASSLPRSTRLRSSPAVLDTADWSRSAERL